MSIQTQEHGGQPESTILNAGKDLPEFESNGLEVQVYKPLSETPRTRCVSGFKIFQIL